MENIIEDMVKKRGNNDKNLIIYRFEVANDKEEKMLRGRILNLRIEENTTYFLFFFVLEDKLLLYFESYIFEVN